MKDPFLAAMGNRLVARRKELHLTQEQLAEKASLLPQMISTAKRGTKALRPENLAKLSVALGVSADYLLTGKTASQDIIILEKQIEDLPSEQFYYLEAIIRNFLASYKDAVNKEPI